MYNSDMIIANTDEVAAYLEDAIEINRNMYDCVENINKRFQAIAGWDDNIQEKTADVLTSVEKKVDVLFEYIQKLNRDLDDYLAELNDYNNPNSGALGRL